MRTALTLLVGSVLLSSSAFAAWDDCGCSCPNSGPYYNTQQQPVMRKTSDAGGSDGYFLKSGKVMVFRNGNISEVNQEITLSNGGRLLADGTIIFSDGRRETLRDSQWLTIDGQISDSAAAVNRFDNRSNVNQDGYFLQNGRVMVFRNNTSSQLTNETTLSNGTRIMADGTVIMRDGTRSTLREGQRLDLEGRTSVNASHQEVQPTNTTNDRFNNQNQNRDQNNQFNNQNRDQNNQNRDQNNQNRDQNSRTDVRSSTTVPNQGNQLPTDSARPNDRSTTSPSDVKKTETHPNDRSVPSTPHDSKTLDSKTSSPSSTPSTPSRPNDRSVPSTPQDSKTLDQK